MGGMNTEGPNEHFEDSLSSRDSTTGHQERKVTKDQVIKKVKTLKLLQIYRIFQSHVTSKRRGRWL